MHYDISTQSVKRVTKQAFIGRDTLEGRAHPRPRKNLSSERKRAHTYYDCEALLPQVSAPLCALILRESTSLAHTFCERPWAARQVSHSKGASQAVGGRHFIHGMPLSVRVLCALWWGWYANWVVMAGRDGISLGRYFACMHKRKTSRHFSPYFFSLNSYIHFPSFPLCLIFFLSGNKNVMKL